jgi:rfaE bifunctional protein kinase chain/domain
LIRLSQKRLEAIIEKAKNEQIIIVGDLMVDHYLWGDVTRISPEAPVPIINMASEQYRFGGAANVGFNILGLQAIPLLVGVVGEDRMGKLFLEMLKDNNLPTDGIVTVPDRPTTVKTRIIGNNQHIARVDQELTAPISLEVQEALFKSVVKHIDKSSGLVIQDYNKGVIVPHLVNHLTELADRHGKIITVDPKFENFLSFKNVTVFKPNIKETEAALAVWIRNEEDLIKASQALIEKLNCDSVLITRGEQGMLLFEKDGTSTLISTKAREIADVSGAGDTVIATLTFALGGGANIKEAVTLSNYAAGLVCEEVGVVPVKLEKLKKLILEYQNE